MISKWLTAKEIADILGKDKRVINRDADDGKWHFRTETGRGGTHRIYQVTSLPEDVQTAYAASLSITLEEIQKQLRPSAGHKKKANIAGYNGRGAKTKEARPLGQATDEAPYALT
jgi:hypothetical protein